MDAFFAPGNASTSTGSLALRNLRSQDTVWTNQTFGQLQGHIKSDALYLRRGIGNQTNDLRVRRCLTLRANLIEQAAQKDFSLRGIKLEDRNAGFVGFSAAQGHADKPMEFRNLFGIE